MHLNSIGLGGGFIDNWSKHETHTQPTVHNLPYATYTIGMHGQKQAAICFQGGLGIFVTWGRL